MGYLSRLFEIGHSGHRQIRSMEGLRGLAVFMVFIVHYTTLIEPWLAPDSETLALTRVLRNVGNAGVDLFFVLSGYLIYGTLIAKPRSLAVYFRRRVQRIYPAFLSVFVVYLLLSWLFPAQSKIPVENPLAAVAYILGNLLLLPGFFPIEPMITVAWSLSYEMFYYLAVPLVIGVLRLRSWSRRARVIGFLGMAAFGLGCAQQCGGSHVRLVMFVAGILLFEATQSRRLPVIDLAGILAFVAAAVMIATVAQGAARFAVLFVCFFLLCYAAFRSEGWTYRVFCWTPMRWLGNMSYSYYLLHGLALKAAFLVLGRLLEPDASWGAIGCWSLMPPMFLLTLVPSAFLFAWIEKPFSLAVPLRGPAKEGTPATVDRQA